MSFATVANTVSQQQQAVNAFQQPFVQQPIYMDPNSAIAPQPMTQTLPQIPLSQPQTLATMAPEEALGQIRNVIQKVTRQNSIVQDPNLMVQNVQLARQPSIDQVFIRQQNYSSKIFCSIQPQFFHRQKIIP